MMLLLLAAFALPKLTAYGQSNYCVKAQCSNLKVEVVRHGNVSPGCTSDTNLCYDKFRQIAYTVYLRHSKTVSASDPLLPFDLEYDMLDITVSLNNISPQFSNIDVNATQTCFSNGVGAKWLNYNDSTGNKAILTATGQSVTISFANLTPGSPDCGIIMPNNTGNVITFKYPTLIPVFPTLVNNCGSNGPPMVRCAYAELFTVIVNAYPGELNGLKVDLTRYLQSPVTPECNIEKVMVGPNYGLNNVTVLPPTHYGATANSKIFAKLLPSVPGGINEKVFQIQIENTGMQDITVNNLEFMIRAMTVNIDQPFAYNIATPQVSTSNGGTNLHYVIPNLGVTLTAGQTYLVGSITVKTPSLSNLSWAANFAFQDSGASPSKSRIKTSEGCTSLNASPIHSSDLNAGDALCIDPKILFYVGGEGLTCSTSKVNVGLSTTNPPATIRLNKVEFELEFTWSAPGISITGVNFPASWPALNCATFGCYGPSNQKSCWEVGPGGKTFKFCYQTDDQNAPLFWLNDFANIEILFNTPENACIETVKISKVKINYVGTDNPPPCIPVIDDLAGFPLCGSMTTMLTGTIATELGLAVEEVSVTMSGADALANAGMAACPNVSCLPAPCLPVVDLSDDAGVYLFSCAACSACNRMKVVPEKDDNHINGVTTFDLVLISKHILGVEPLNSPFKMIAADANKSGSITTFDIVEIRKLILGIYPTALPNNKSWRFVDKTFVFPNANNPFQTPFPEGINCVAFPASGIDFTGVKVGDVNNTAVGNRPVERPVVSLSWPNLRTAVGGTVTVPIIYSGTEPMAAIQLGLRFDPNKLQLIGPSLGDIESYLPGNFNLLKANEGEIRTLWLPMTDGVEMIQPGKVLFYLTFKVLEELPVNELPLWLDNKLLDCAAWKPDGIECAIQQTYASAKRDEPVAVILDLQASIHPNPTVGDATLVVQARKAEKARIALSDAFGSRLFMRELLLEEGRQNIPLPEVAQLPGGVYVWKVYTPNFKTQGHLVKQ